MRGGVDLSVPRGRVRALKAVSGSAEAGYKPAPAPSAPATGRGITDDDGDQSREELERERVRVERHAVRAQVRISQARARGDSPKALRRLEKEIERTERRKREMKQALGLK
jgi:hypothetical protein